MSASVWDFNVRTVVDACNFTWGLHDVLMICCTQRLFFVVASGVKGAV